MRTWTVILQAHTHQFLDTFGGFGNGDYRGELQRAIGVITTCAMQLGLPLYLRPRAIRWPLGEPFRSCAYLCPELCKHPPRKRHDAIALRLRVRSLDLCRAQRAPGVCHPCSHWFFSRRWTQHDGMVYELFVGMLPSPAFTASDVLDLYLHRGSFETVLADEDDEQDSDRWYSHTPCGQEFAQIIAQWIWNIRMELGQQFSQEEQRYLAREQGLPVRARIQDQDDAKASRRRRSTKIRQVEQARQWDRQRSDIHPALVSERLAAVGQCPTREARLTHQFQHLPFDMSTDMCFLGKTASYQVYCFLNV